jgi:hypothetical protein
MSKLLGCAIALALTLSVMPALAGDVTPADQTPATFLALHQLPVGDRAALTPLSADQLAAIEGGQPGAIIVGAVGDALRPAPLMGLGLTLLPLDVRCGECSAPGAIRMTAPPEFGD